MAKKMLSIIAMPIGVVAVVGSIVVLSGTVSIWLILGLATAERFLEYTAITLSAVFLVAFALQVSWRLLNTHRGTAVLDLAFIVLALGGLTSILDIPEFAL